ncbi:SpoIIE family protein phosphatase [Streptomyces sp. NPDC017993]|uniref:SpoIIE family protein phosphatase n=1 Tax=Streptomyces sp. NPDC017993 TaxID=3365027 RepID=UPI0037A4279E
MPADRPRDANAGTSLWSEPGSLLEHVAVAVFGIDDENRICYWGPGAHDLFGHQAPDVLAKPGAMLFAEPSADEPDACSRMAARGRAEGYWRGRLLARHQDGTDFDCGFRVFPVTGVEGRSVVMALSSRGDELDRVKTNLAFLDALFERCPIGLVMLDEDLRYLHLNQALADMNGLPIEEHLGRRLTEIMITSEGGEYERMLRTVVAEGRTVVGVRVGMRTLGHPDRDLVLSVSFFPLTGAVGTRQGVGGLLVDVTDREQAIVEATATRQRLALLDRASARFGTTLDVVTTAQELVEAAVPDFSDGAVVELVDWLDEREVFDPALPVMTRRIASGTVLPAPATELVSGVDVVHYPPGSAIHQMLRTGRPITVPVTREFMVRTIPDDRRARLMAESGLACLLLAPLIARGTVQGIAIFGRSAARATFTEPDLSLAGELASRAALCLDNARLYSRERDIALTLQRALLPSSLGTSPYLHIAHRYLPGGRVTEVGGDWYDVIALPGDHVGLLVGDVMGHGVAAAASMGRLRITAKALARHHQVPHELVAELDLCAREAGIELATCLYIHYDPASGRARMASAGHPPPLVLQPDGRTDVIDEVLGVPLGVGGSPFRTTEALLPDGATLVLYTDGLIEARGRDIDEGLQSLRTELGRLPDSLEAAADQILERLVPSSPADDTVLLLARVHRLPR